MSTPAGKLSRLHEQGFVNLHRKPLYFASFLLTVGGGLLSTRMDFMRLTGTCYLAIFFPMMLSEAHYLRRKFEDFSDHEKQVPLVFPNFTLWESRRVFEINFSLVMRTLLDSPLTLLAVPVILLAARYS